MVYFERYSKGEVVNASPGSCWTRAATSSFAQQYLHTLSSILVLHCYLRAAIEKTVEPRVLTALDSLQVFSVLIDF